MTGERIFVCISCYNKHDDLAHQPRGKEAEQSLYLYELDVVDGSMVLLTVNNVSQNPAFTRFNPKNNILYTCTEYCTESGEVYAFKVNPNNGALQFLNKQDAGGTSTCYITFDKDENNMLLTNYWDATLITLPVYNNGYLGPIKAAYDAKTSDICKTSLQRKPHPHALVLDPIEGKMAFVPDKGMDIIRQFVYKSETGELLPAGIIPSGPMQAWPHGPRYMQFHHKLPFAYLVNELSSNVCVFHFSIDAARENVESDGSTAEPCLTFVQMISAIPEAFPKELTTSARISIDPSGNFVLVSNRGHNSIAVYRIKQSGKNIGQLKYIHHCHTGGETPRHYQFDPSGQWLLVVNQDTDSLSIYHFDVITGRIKSTGNLYKVPSPNFVCCFRVTSEDESKTISNPSTATDGGSFISPTYGLSISYSKREQAVRYSNL